MMLKRLFGQGTPSPDLSLSADAPITTRLVMRAVEGLDTSGLSDTELEAALREISSLVDRADASSSGRSWFLRRLATMAGGASLQLLAGRLMAEAMLRAQREA